jgi:sugar phosphate isomerase/epimerase
MSIKFSVFTVMIPELGYAEAAELVAQHGYEGVEWRIGFSGNVNPNDTPTAYARGIKGDYTYWSRPRDPVLIRDLVKTAPLMKKAADAAGITIPAMATYLNLATPDLLEQVEEVFKAAQIMECPQFRIGSPKYFRDKTTQTYGELYDIALGQLGQLEKLSRKYGIRVNTELHAESITPSASSGYHLVSRFDPKHIGVILDPGNMIKEGYENWRMGMQILGKYLVHVHAKNCVWTPKERRADGAATFQRSWVSLRDGAADWPMILADLKSVGYDGWISLEDFAPRPTEEKLAESIKYFKAIQASLEAPVAA